MSTTGSVAMAWNQIVKHFIFGFPIVYERSEKLMGSFLETRKYSGRNKS